MASAEIPLFPLHAVLFPDGRLALRIFEQRYLSMIRDCARSSSGFGVCLILQGEEAAVPVEVAQVGTLANIVDWYTLEGGLLGVSALGAGRFRIRQSQVQADGLMRGRVDWLAEAAPLPVPPAYQLLSQVLAKFMEKAGSHYPSCSRERLDDSGWVGYRLAELLPLPPLEKQRLLEMDDPLARLQALLEALPRFR